jgi:hypothetical protein
MTTSDKSKSAPVNKDSFSKSKDPGFGKADRKDHAYAERYEVPLDVDPNSAKTPQGKEQNPSPKNNIKK